MTNPTHRTALQILFTMGAEDRHADVALVAAELGLSCTDTNAVLEELDRACLVNAETVRLTMSGLVVGASLGRIRRRASGSSVVQGTTRSRATRVQSPKRSSSRAA